MVGVISLVTGMAGPSGFGSASTAEQVTEGVDASNLTAIITGQFSFAISSKADVTSAGILVEEPAI